MIAPPVMPVTALPGGDVKSAEFLILGLCALWLLGSLGVTAVFGAFALRGRRQRRKLRTSGGSVVRGSVVRQSPAVVRGQGALDAELDRIALRLRPLYAGPAGDDRRFTSHDDHDDWRHA